jgi:hypothetical protein
MLLKVRWAEHVAAEIVHCRSTAVYYHIRVKTVEQTVDREITTIPARSPPHRGEYGAFDVVTGSRVAKAEIAITHVGLAVYF